MLGASNISSATLAVVFQDRSLDVAWWPAMAGFLIWFSWLYIQSTLVRSRSNFVIVSSSKSLTFENSMHRCCYWCNKLLKVQWFKIAQKCDVDGSVMQKSKMGLTRLTCLLLGVSSGGSQAGWISWPFTAARGSGCPSVVSGSQDFLTCHPSMLSALPPLSTHGRLPWLHRSLVWIEFEMPTQSFGFRSLVPSMWCCFGASGNFKRWDIVGNGRSLRKG